MGKNNLLINFINGISKHFASAIFGIEFIGIYIWSDIFNNHQVDSLGFLIVSMWLVAFLFDKENKE